MSPIDHVHDALDMRFRVQRSMKRGVIDGSSELAMSKDVCEKVD